MKYFRYLSTVLFLLLLTTTVEVNAQTPNCVPTATLIMENGMLPEEETILPDGDSYTGAAPLEFRFAANPIEGTSTWRYEWTFAEDEDFSAVLFTRFDEETSYTFTTSGTYYVLLQVTDTESEQTFMSNPFMFQITESELTVPNAFSPNGDGTNDIFKVKHKSLVKFNAYIFDRYGKEIYRWNLSNIDDGWDGTTGGKQVKAGVYFILIEAQGADGVVYTHKGDINILK
ncbi:gliding motility-associated C-terminal domain-containing protein [Bacteroides sp. 214]|uniref:T9SS type B sorting domain-containing protein n=1 Tax=Bacteroides sp. 214 TaxID=2302935 RepID=UPI0013D41DBF|nr:gliding motility-associated C-terminal domain-containing protein [Bacteroides sp. 214]NDW12713.1 gliding motility-associated C-terminal domain-containing protein [Bacteroides sp. 214]